MILKLETAKSIPGVGACGQTLSHRE